jgi:hypothetical protein
VVGSDQDQKAKGGVRREALRMDEGFRRYLNQFQEWTKSYCAPVFFRGDSDQLRNGSMTFVNTGQEVLGITAGHVADSVKKFLTDLSLIRSEIHLPVC